LPPHDSVSWLLPKGDASARDGQPEEKVRSRVSVNPRRSYKLRRSDILFLIAESEAKRL